MKKESKEMLMVVIGVDVGVEEGETIMLFQEANKRQLQWRKLVPN